jgi:ElaB/YqjD/DUF883 family membrane-anchored ribosome-binding protein
MAIQEDTIMQRHDGPEERRSAAAGGSYTERAAGAVHEGVDRLKERIEPREEQLREKAAQAEERLREAAANAQGKLRDARGYVSDQYGDVATQTRAYVREHPLTAAAVAFAAGVLIVSWLRR